MLAPRRRLRSDLARHQRIGLLGVFLIGMKQSRETLPVAWRSNGNFSHLISDRRLWFERVPQPLLASTPSLAAASGASALGPAPWKRAAADTAHGLPVARLDAKRRRRRGRRPLPASVALAAFRAR